jgi:hypothetical protein
MGKRLADTRFGRHAVRQAQRATHIDEAGRRDADKHVEAGVREREQALIQPLTKESLEPHSVREVVVDLVGQSESPQDRHR